MKEIISASRRTDLPRFFLDETIESFERGFIELVNPFNKKPYNVIIDKENVGAIVWWSKDYKVFLDRFDYFKKFNNFFQFTLNGYSDSHVQKLLEIGVTSSLDERIAQAKKLSEIKSPECITWRFDPIVFWVENNDVKNNLGDFEYISESLGGLGIERCVISFCDWNYRKVVRRAEKRGFKYLRTDMDEKKKYAKNLAVINKKNGIQTYSCASDALVDGEYVKKSRCIDGDLLGKIFGIDFSLSKDAGQREECGCTKSRDIGDYNQKCKHYCLYCYSNPLYQ